MSDNRVLECESCGWQGVPDPMPAFPPFPAVTHHRMRKVGNPFASPYILCDDCLAAGIASGQWVEHPLFTKEEGYDE